MRPRVTAARSTGRSRVAADDAAASNSQPQAVTRTEHVRAPSELDGWIDRFLVWLAVERGLAANTVVLPQTFFGEDETDVRAAFAVAGYGSTR